MGIGVGRDIESFKNISLEATNVEKTWTGETQIQIPASGKTDGVYWMKVEIDGEEVTVQNAVVISGMPSSSLLGFDIGPLISIMIIMMMMKMMMSFMEDPRAFIKKTGEVVAKVGEAAAPLVQIFTRGKGGK